MVLASASPRRRQLLQLLGLDFQVIPSAVERDKKILPVSPGERAMELAAGKAEDVAAVKPDALVIAADTLVAAGGRLLGKPRDEEEAREMLTFLSGRRQEVYTGVALYCAAENRKLVDCESTIVQFRTLSGREIEAYVRSGEPMDKAGAYGIQGLGAVLVERIEGCFYNVVGLPLTRLALMLKGFGLEVLEVKSHGGYRHQKPTR